VSKVVLITSILSCMKSCGIGAPDTGSKFAPKKTEGDIHLAHQDDEDICDFCPANDMLYPDRTMASFGGGRYTCRQVDEFIEIMQFTASNPNCEFISSLDYVCGCAGSGYAGANTHSKQAALAWMPRVSAILSIMVSTCTIYMVHVKHRMIPHHLML
jgi:hypothetical protein